MKVEFAIKKWTNDKLNKLSGFIAGKDYYAVDINKSRKIREIIENIQRGRDHISSLVILFKAHKRCMGPFAKDITEKDLADTASELLDEYKNITRSYALKHLLEFKNFNF